MLFAATAASAQSPDYLYDAIHAVSSQRLLISTAGTPTVSGASGARLQDVLSCGGTSGATSTCSWRMHFDGSVVGLSTWDEDVDAL